MRILIYLSIFALFCFAGWVVKIRLKKRLSRGLGRPADDHELTSLNAWMETTPGTPDATSRPRRESAGGINNSPKNS